MVAAGRIDQLLKVECRDNDELPALIHDVIRAIPGVRATETFTYLHLEKP
jgi:Lrp/AsnC family transcriptional regulator, regulator for asnA, asnC and gidA